MQHVWRNVEMLLSGYLKIMQVVLTCFLLFCAFEFQGDQPFDCTGKAGHTLRGVNSIAYHLNPDF